VKGLIEQKHFKSEFEKLTVANWDCLRQPVPDRRTACFTLTFIDAIWYTVLHRHIKTVTILYIFKDLIYYDLRCLSVYQEPLLNVSIHNCLLTSLLPSE